MARFGNYIIVGGQDVVEVLDMTTLATVTQYRTARDPSPWLVMGMRVMGNVLVVSDCKQTVRLFRIEPSGDVTFNRKLNVTGNCVASDERRLVVYQRHDLRWRRVTVFDFDPSMQPDCFPCMDLICY